MAEAAAATEDQGHQLKCITTLLALWGFREQAAAF